MQSHFLRGVLESNKISAIGLYDVNDGIKESPFLEAESIYEFQNSMKNNQF